MQTLQKKYGDKNVVWLTIASSTEGDQGFVDVKGAPAVAKSHKANKTAKPLFPSALDASIAGQKIAEDTTKPYGCGIKYK